MILLDATVNGKPAVLLLDTGADATIVSLQASGLSTAKLRTLTTLHVLAICPGGSTLAPIRGLRRADLN